MKPCPDAKEVRCDLVNRIIAKQDILAKWQELGVSFAIAAG